MLLGNGYIVWIIIRYMWPWAWENKTSPSVMEPGQHD